MSDEADKISDAKNAARECRREYYGKVLLGLSVAYFVCAWAWILVLNLFPEQLKASPSNPLYAFACFVFGCGGILFGVATLIAWIGAFFVRPTIKCWVISTILFLANFFTWMLILVLFSYLLHLKTVQSV